MKTTINKFDYPTAASHTYKLYNRETSIGPQMNQQQKLHKKNLEKQRYKQVIQEQRQNQRARVKMEQERRLEQERINNKKKIRQELENKKKQLIELEKKKAEALQAEKISYEMALVRQQQQKINQMQKQRKQKQNQFHAQNRFVSALRRLQQEKDIANQKKKQAVNRRKVIEITEKVQRQKAIKYRELIQDQQKLRMPEQKRSFRDYKQTLGRTAYNYNVDYTQTHIHNPMIVLPNDQAQIDALAKAEQQNRIQEQKQRKKQENRMKNKKASQERGQKAIQRIRLQQQYEKYKRQQQVNSIKYNLERIEAGKKNQYVGLKPTTVSQMEIQRKIRRQEQFEQMFFCDKKPECFSQPATKYNIGQARLGDTQVPIQVIPLSRGNTRSNYADISQGHYSFEQGQGIDDLTTVKKQDPYEYQYHQEQVHNQEMNPLKQYENIRASSQYKSGTNKLKQDLNYSQSEEEDSRNF